MPLILIRLSIGLSFYQSLLKCYYDQIIDVHLFGTLWYMSRDKEYNSETQRLVQNVILKLEKCKATSSAIA